jgi:hypothetical protein
VVGTLGHDHRRSSGQEQPDKRRHRLGRWKTHAGIVRELTARESVRMQIAPLSSRVGQQ